MSSGLSLRRKVNESLSKYLVALIWPVGIALILAATFLTARRAPAIGQRARAGAREAAMRHGRQVPGLRDVVFGGGQLVIFAAAGALVVFGVLSLLGVLVVAHGLTVDRPIFVWMQTHQVHAMTALSNRLTKIGDTWTTWGADSVAAVCLAATFGEKRWLPPVVLAFAEVYSRIYLSKHWTTDALSGVLYGALLLAAFIAAIRLVAGSPVARPAEPGDPGAGSRFLLPGGQVATPGTLRAP